MALNDELVIKIKALTDDFTKGVNAAVGSLDNLNKAVNTSGMDRLKASTQQLSNELGQLSQKLTVSMLAMTGSITLFLKTSGDFEQWKVAFETMLGSGEKASKLMNDLVAFAAKTPFNATEVVEYSKRLLAMGIEMKDIIPTMESLGNIAAGVGKDKLQQLVLAFGQVKAAGHLTGMELRQFTEAGVPLLDELAKVFGKTTGEIQKMISEGEISFKAVDVALKNLSGEGGRFAGLMERQNQTLLGQLSNLKDNLVLVMKSLGDAIAPTFKDIISSLVSLTEAIKGMDPATLAAIAKTFLAIGTAVTGLFIVSKVTSLFLGLASSALSLASGLKSAFVVMQGLQAGTLTFSALLSPMIVTIGAVVAAFAALAAVVGTLYYNFKVCSEEQLKFNKANGDYAWKASVSNAKELRNKLEELGVQYRANTMAIEKLKLSENAYSATAYKELMKRLTDKDKALRDEINLTNDSLKKQLEANVAHTEKLGRQRDLQGLKAQKTAEQEEAEEKKALDKIRNEYKSWFESQSALRDVDLNEQIAKLKNMQSQHKNQVVVYKGLENDLNELRAKLRNDSEKLEADSLKNILDIHESTIKKQGLLSSQRYADESVLITKYLNLNSENSEKIKKLITDTLSFDKDSNAAGYIDKVATLDKTLQEMGLSNEKRKVVIDSLQKYQKDVNDKETEDYKKHLNDMYNIGLGFTKDFQGTLSTEIKKMFGSSDSGFGKDLKDGLASLFYSGNDKTKGLGAILTGAGSLLAGALGGLIGTGVDAILGGLFGSGKYKTVQEYAKEAFDEMVSKTNEKLDDIGRQKSVAEKQVDILQELRKINGGNATLSSTYSTALGLQNNPGITIDEAIKKKLNDVNTYNSQQRAILSDEYNRLNPVNNIVNRGGDSLWGQKAGDVVAVLRAIGKTDHANTISHYFKDSETIDWLKVMNNKDGRYPFQDLMYSGEIQAAIKRYNELKDIVPITSLGGAQTLLDELRLQERSRDVTTTHLNDIVSNFNTAIDLLQKQKAQIGGGAKISSSTVKGISSLTGLETFSREVSAGGTSIFDSIKTLLNDLLFYSPDSGMYATIDTMKRNLDIKDQIKKLQDEMTATLPQLDVGAFNIPRDMPAMLHRNEMVIPAKFTDGIMAGKLTLSAAGSDNSDNRNITVYIQGGTKSGAQIYNEIAPYIGSIRKSDFGQYNGVSRG